MNKLVNGVVVPLTSDEIKDLETRKAAAPSETDIKWRQVRSQRNSLLAECDWRAFSDVTLSNEWKTYRQALRDVPLQSDPDNITWPTKPS